MANSNSSLVIVKFCWTSRISSFSCSWTNPLGFSKDMFHQSSIKGHLPSSFEAADALEQPPHWHQPWSIMHAWSLDSIQVIDLTLFRDVAICCRIHLTFSGCLGKWFKKDNSNIRQVKLILSWGLYDISRNLRTLWKLSMCIQYLSQTHSNNLRWSKFNCNWCCVSCSNHIGPQTSWIVSIFFCFFHPFISSVKT